MMRTFAVVTVLVAVATLAHAQSLADVARAEEARRKNVQKSSKTYTNDDLRADFTAPAPPTAPPASMAGAIAAQPAAKPGGPPAAGGAAAAPASGEAAGAAVRDQAYWSARINAARSAVERNRMFIDALQSRINALTTDYVNRDDPAQRAAIEQDRLKAVAELERVRREIEDGTKAIAAIEDEARRAGVPAGWLR